MQGAKLHFSEDFSKFFSNIFNYNMKQLTINFEKLDIVLPLIIASGVTFEATQEKDSITFNFTGGY